MSPLPSDMEESFARSLLDQEGVVPDGLTSYSEPVPQTRFNIYRNNVHVSLIDMMAAKFPVVLKLVGEEFFRGLARVYIRAEPPKSALTLEYGAGFPGFLEDFEHVQDVPYLADVARLEWLRLEAYNAADREPLSPEELALIDHDRLGETRFQLHPSLRTLRSDYPVMSIWEANMQDGDLSEIDMAGGGEEVLIVRPGLDVEILKMPSASCDFVRDLGSGISLHEANARALDANEGFDLQLVLSGLIRCGVFTGFSN